MTSDQAEQLQKAVELREKALQGVTSCEAMLQNAAVLYADSLSQLRKVEKILEDCKAEIGETRDP